jgi:hemerythrin superfamily protein
MNEITRMFVLEHGAINALLKEYSNEKDPERKKIFMKDAQRQLFAHFKEEELYYSKYDANIKETVLTLKRLISEHELMSDMIRQDEPDIPIFIKFIIVHEHIEENSIYPELEKYISTEDIQILMKKLLRE